MTQCPHCHAKTPHHVVVVEQDDFERRRALLTGKLDRDFCDSCERPLDRKPAIVVRGEPADVRPVHDLLQAAVRGEHWTWLSEHWPLLSPEVLAAAGLAVVCPDEVPRLTIGGAEQGRLMGLDPLLNPDGHDRFVVEQALTGLQIRVWQALAADWSAGSRDGSLHADLRRYIVLRATPRGGHHLFPVTFDELPGDPYVRAAVQAAVASAAGIDNPHAGTWALLYFAAELALRRRPDDPVLLARRMPPSFAASTIDQRAAWTAVSQSLSLLLAEHPVAEAYELVRAIAAQAGHPEVPAAVLQGNAASPHAGARDAEALIERAMPAGDGTPVAAALAGAALELRSLPAPRRTEMLDQVGELVLKRYPADTAEVVVWWAGRHLHHGHVNNADQVLQRLPGDGPCDAATSARLYGVQAGILAARGAVDKAADRWRDAARAAGDDVKLRHWARVNLAILLGASDPDQALELLTDAAYGPDRYGGDHDIFRLIAIHRQRRGETEEATAALQRAQHYADGTAADGFCDNPALLADAATRALDNGDRAEFLRLTAARAAFLQTTGDPAAAELWESLVRLRAEHGFVPEAQELVEAARGRLAGGDAAGMRELLGALPDALTRRYGATAGLTAEPGTLLRPLVDTAALLLQAPQPSATDLRLVGELQRDAVGRARAARLQESPTPAWTGEPDWRIAANGPVGVVEWIQTGDRVLRCMLTRIDATGSRAGWLALPQIDPAVVVRSLTPRLQHWTASRPGDPLADDNWQTLAAGMIEQLGAYLHDEDHVVFLHHGSYANLPWHTAIKERWTVSYAAGWTHIVDLARRAPSRRHRLGLCLVPRTLDDPVTVDALQTAHDRLAATTGVPVTARDPVSCDRRYLSALMADEDVVVLLCHGYHTDESQDVGVALAADGRLPPATGPALDRKPQHLFGRREAQQLHRSAPAVFSAACSTAYSYGTGLGDRLGFGAALRHSGTAAFVAPMWDVLSAPVLPVLTSAVQRYLRGEPLARALRAAAHDASSAGPDWLVWSLALEGDWR